MCRCVCVRESTLDAVFPPPIIFLFFMSGPWSETDREEGIGTPDVMQELHRPLHCPLWFYSRRNQAAVEKHRLGFILFGGMTVKKVFIFDRERLATKKDLCADIRRSAIVCFV